MAQINKNSLFEEHADYRNAWNMIIASFMVNIGFGLAIPLFTSLGDTVDIGNLGFIQLSPALAIGVLLASFMIARMITSYLIPDVTDSAGRKNILIAGLVWYGFTTLLIGFARDFWPLLLLRAFEGGSVGVAFPIAEALMVDSVPKKKRGEWMGKFFITFNAGFAIGPAIGSFLYGIAQTNLHMNQYDAFILPYGITGAMGFISAIIVYFFVHDVYKPVSKHEDDAERAKEFVQARQYKVPFLKKLYTISIINGFAIGLISPIFTLYALNEFSIKVDNVGYIFFVAGVGALPINWISGKLSDKYNRVGLAMIGMSIGTLAFIGIGIFNTFLIVVAFFVIRFMSMMFFVPAYRTFQADIIPPIVRGRYFGRVQSIFNLGAASAPIIGGLMYDNLTGKTFDVLGSQILGAGLIFVFCAVVSLLSTIVIYSIFRIYKPELHSYKEIIGSDYETAEFVSGPIILD